MKIDIDIPDNISNEWRIETFNVEKNEPSQFISMIKTGRCVPEGTYKRLMRGNVVVMSNTPDEINDFLHFYYNARGNVLINGLGLGVTLKALLQKDEITHITVIEKSEDVIKLVAPYYANSKITIINADALKWNPPKNTHYDCVWHDIWDNITSDNLNDMKKLTRKYGKRSDYQECWCRYLCERQYKEEKRRHLYMHY